MLVTANSEDNTDKTDQNRPMVCVHIISAATHALRPVSGTKIVRANATRRTLGLGAATAAVAVSLTPRQPRCDLDGTNVPLEVDTRSSAIRAVLETDALMACAYSQTSQYARQVRMWSGRTSDGVVPPPPAALHKIASELIKASRPFEHALCFIVYVAEVRGDLDGNSRRAWVEKIRERIASLRIAAARAEADTANPSVPFMMRKELGAVLYLTRKTCDRMM
jgi:hypothetical protein